MPINSWGEKIFEDLVIFVRANMKSQKISFSDNLDSKCIMLEYFNVLGKCIKRRGTDN